MPEQAMPEAARTQSGASSRASVVDLAPETVAWDAFVVGSSPGSYLQTSAWAEVKAANGWTPLRFMGTSLAGRATVRETPADPDPDTASAWMRTPGPMNSPRVRLPSGRNCCCANPVSSPGPSPTRRAAQFSRGGTLPRSRLSPGVCATPWPRRRRAFPMCVSSRRSRSTGRSTWMASCATLCALRLAPGTAIQPPRTRQIDLRADEAALWGELRKKWRQYVNKARKSEVRVVDATIDRLPEFYSIYQETAKRAGFIIRTYESYVSVWQAFAKLGMADS